MSRISLVDSSHATADVKPLLDAVQAQLGATPNFIRVLAHSPAALEGFIGLFTISPTRSANRPRSRSICPQ